MPTVIDSLIVELNLDPKKFIGGQKDVEAAIKKLIESSGKGATEVEQRTKSTIDYFEHIKRGLLTTLGVFLGGKGAKDFLNYITSSDAAVGRFADTLDLNIQKLGAWEHAIRSMGGSAESVRGAMGSLNADIKAFEAGVPGGGQFLPIMQALGVDTAGKPVDQILEEASQSVKRRHPTSKARQAFELGQIPGMNQDMINLLLLDQADRRQRLTRGERAAPSEADRRQAEEYQKSTAQFQSAVERFSSAIAYLTSGPLATALSKLTDLIEGWMGKGRHVVTPEQQHQNLRSRFGEPPAWMKNMTGETPSPGAGITAFPSMPKLSKVPSVKDQIAMIRRIAVEEGVDPDQAVRVAKSEGLYNWKSTIPGEESYSPFQLHYGGRGQKGPLAAKGLGDDFTKATGLDAADPANIEASTRFALQHAKRRGWGAWYGWKGDKWAGIGAGAARGAAGGGMGGGGATSTTSIGQIMVNTQATDADGIARDIGKSIERNRVAAPVNFGQE